jgi:hypothetical protein
MGTKSTNTRPSKVAKIGSIISFISLLFTILMFAFGKGRPWQIAIRPQLRVIVQQQLTTGSTVLNACTVKNEGRTNAEDVVIRIWSEEGVPFRGLNITGAEGDWDIEGGEGESYANISLPRLVATHILTATVRTDAPITFRCEVADTYGLAERSAQGPFSLRVGDFVLLILPQILVLAVAFFWLFSRSRNRG